MLIMDDNEDQLHQLLEQVEAVSEVGHPYAMASEHWTLYLCRHPRNWNLKQLWPELKKWN